MTYPHLEKVSKETLLAILKEVELEYLVDRKGALDSEIAWEDTLSLSEKVNDVTGGPKPKGTYHGQTTALVLQLCRILREKRSIGVVTNDIFTREARRDVQSVWKIFYSAR